MEESRSRWLYFFILISLVSVFLFPKKTYASSSWLKYFRKDSLVNTYMRTYCAVGDNLWVGTNGDGIVIYTGKKTINFNNKNTRTRPQYSDGLISDCIKCMAVDEKKGRVWIGTNAGLSSCDLDCKNWVSYREKDGLPSNVIRDLVVDKKGHLWIGTPSGLAYFDGEKFKIYNTKNGLKQNSIHSLKIQGDSLWVGTVGGTVSMFKDGKWKSYIRYN